MRWMDFPSDAIDVRGLGFFDETRPGLTRLPERAKDLVRPEVWDIAQHPSGGRLSFSTDSSVIRVKGNYPRHYLMPNMTHMGQAGIDCYAAGKYCGTQVIEGCSGEFEYEFQLRMDKADKTTRHIDLYLPLYAPVEVNAVGVSDDAVVGKPLDFAIEKPVVYYGSSITQGGCASRPGLSYQAFIHRTLNVDFVNLGFSGNGKGEPEVAELMAEIDASCFVLDWSVNCDSPDQAAARYAPFVGKLREKHQYTPIILVTPTHHVNEVTDGDKRHRMTAFREIVRMAYVGFRNYGSRNLRLIEGEVLLGPDDDCGLVDGIHPNDIGFMRIAERLQPAIRDMLALPR